MVPYEFGSVVLLLGFRTGLLAFKVKSRWCPECGATTNATNERRQAAAQ